MANKQTKKLRVIPLGGVDEIGKNMTAIEYGEDIVIIDCGSIFPKEDMYGIDLVIPDFSYLERNRDKVKAFLITHGHEDHIGALPYVLKRIDAPIYCTSLTRALIEYKFKEHKINGAVINTIHPKDKVRIGKFEVEFIKTNHSIGGRGSAGHSYSHGGDCAYRRLQGGFYARGRRAHRPGEICRIGL